MLDIKQASVEEIAIFKQAAAARYAARKIEPKLASQLFDRQMSRVGQELGVIEQPKLQKLAAAIAQVVKETRQAKK